MALAMEPVAIKYIPRIKEGDKEALIAQVQLMGQLVVMFSQ